MENEHLEALINAFRRYSKMSIELQTKSYGQGTQFKAMAFATLINHTCSMLDKINHELTFFEQRFPVR